MKSIFPVITAICLALFYCVAASGQTSFKSIDTNNEKINACWELNIDNVSRQKIASDKVSALYFIKDKNTIESVNLTNRQSVWTFETGGEIFPELIADSENLYVVNSVKNSVRNNSVKNDEQNRYFLRSINNKSGLVGWVSEIEFSGITLDAGLNDLDAGVNAHLYQTNENVLFGLKSCFVNVNKNDGSISWSRCYNESKNPTSAKSANSYKNNSNGLFDTSGDFYAYSDGIYVYIVSIKNGQIIHKLLLKTPVSAKTSIIKLIDDSTVVIGDEKGNLFLYKSRNAKPSWTFKSGGRISGIIKTNRGLLITSFDNFAYMLDEKNGGTVWRKRFANRIKFKPFNEENLAIITVDEKSAFFVNTSNGDIIYQISLPDEVNFLNAPYASADNYLFLTDKGILGYGTGACKKESGKAYQSASLLTSLLKSLRESLRESVN
ncbi:MAG: enzyme repeat-containing protein [Acidobacteria bacterium]|nr:enzyme repeat-containing protein [Acidobacteriota bacterium]